MAIYKPFSTLAQTGAAIGSSLLSGIASDLSGSISAGVPNTAIGRAAASLASAGIGVGFSEVERRISSPLSRAAYKLDNRLSEIKNVALNTFGLGVFGYDSIAIDALRSAGNLSMQDLYHIWQETNPDGLSRSNFYVLEINDRSNAQPVSKGDGRYSKFHLLTNSLSFNAFEVQGESIEIGSVMIDKVTGSARTEMQLTVMDTELGIIKRWAELKSQMTTQSNGLVMPPSFYIFDVKVIFGTNVAYRDYYNQVYQMRIGSMMHSLDRGEYALEEVQLQFVQWDTCMPSFAE